MNVISDHKMRSALGNAVIFLLTISLGLLTVEFMLRIKTSNQQNYNIEMWRYAKRLKIQSKDPILGHEHRANASAKLQGVEIKLNHFGMRGPEPDLGDHRRKRVLFLGSSNTLGWGVEEEDTMTALLQETLGEKVQIFNAGIGNYNALRYVTLLEKKLLALKPDIVVVNYFVNDAEVLKPGGGNVLLRHSQLAVLLHHFFQSLWNGPSDMSKLITYYRAVYTENGEGRKTMEAAFAHLNELSQRHQFKIIFTMTPDIHVLKPYPFTFVHDYVRQLSALYHWPFVDVTEALSQVPSKKLWALSGDPHLNRLGHQIMASALLPTLKEEI